MMMDPASGRGKDRGSAPGDVSAPEDVRFHFQLLQPALDEIADADDADGANGARHASRSDRPVTRLLSRSCLRRARMKRVRLLHSLLKDIQEWIAMAQARP
jgi:hypothetical protein